MGTQACGMNNFFEKFVSAVAATFQPSYLLTLGTMRVFFCRWCGSRTRHLRRASDEQIVQRWHKIVCHFGRIRFRMGICAYMGHHLYHHINASLRHRLSQVFPSGLSLAPAGHFESPYRQSLNIRRLNVYRSIQNLSFLA